MIYNLKKVQDADVNNKKVLLRVDVDVPVVDGVIQDESRLKAWFPTLEYLINANANAKIYLIGHMGRPKQQFPTPVSTPFGANNFQFTISEPNLSLKPVAEWVSKKVNGQIEEEKIDIFNTWKIRDDIYLLENLRFFEGEEKNDPAFVKKLALIGDVFINDAFATAHRAHASTEGITKFLPSFAGVRVQKEVEELSRVLENPLRPLAVMIGGAKIETKLPLVEKMHRIADLVLVGGEIAENDKILLKVQHEDIEGRKSVLLVADLNQDLKDITPKSSENFIQVLQNTGTIVWNGPMGLVEQPPFDTGTKTLADGIAKLSAYKILGGGDTVSCIQKIGVIDKFNFVSTGGGAMLEFLSGEKLPGLVALEVHS